MSNKTVIQLGVSIDGLRKAIFRDCLGLINAVQPLLDEYKKNDGYYVQIDRDDALQLFDKINSLRGFIGALMCCYLNEIGMSDLSNLTNEMPFIKYEDEDDE